MIVVCKKEYNCIKVGDLVEILPRSNSLVFSEFDELNCKFPVAAIYLSDISYFKFIYYNEYKEHFCSISEYRRNKLFTLNK